MTEKLIHKGMVGEMKDFVHSVKFKILVGILALLFGLMLYAATTGGKQSFVASLMGTVFSPVQKVSSSISNKVSSSLDKFINADEYYDQNQKLRQQLNEQYNQMVDYDKIKEENEHYKEIFGLKDKYPSDKFSPPCRIIGRTTNDIYQSFFIDKGSSDGISLRDPVITGDGLIGIVSEVESTYSKVTTVLSPEYPIGVYCSRTKETGIIEGNYDLAKDGVTRMKMINRDSDIKPGDIIVTSGYSGLVPKDRIIGIVSEVSTDKTGLSINATIKPVANIASITNVFVITEFEGQGVGFNE